MSKQKTAQINVNLLQLQIMRDALVALKDKYAAEIAQYCYDMNTQPSATADLLMNSDAYKSLLNCNRELDKIQNQLAYQERRLTSPTKISFGGKRF